MKDVFFTWHGGEGGDFIMSVLARFLNNNHTLQVSNNGKCQNIDSFTHKNLNFYKSHLLWKDNNYKQSTNKFVFLIINPNLDMMLRKKFKKFLPNSIKDIKFYNGLVNGNTRIINKKILQSIQKKDYKNAYYYGYKAHKTSYLHYEKQTLDMIKNVPHSIINTKLILYQDVITVFDKIATSLNLKIKLNNDLELFCMKYIESQQEFLESWPYLEH